MLWAQAINQMFFVVVADLRDLMNELTEVNNWMHLGLNLGLKLSTLEAIQTNNNTTADRRNQMLIAWQKQVTPTWYTVVQALVNMGMSQLAQKHG